MAIDLVKNSRDVEIEKLKRELEDLKSQSAQQQAEAPSSGPTIAPTETDNRDAVQIELDTAEEFVINNLFPNGLKVNAFIKTYLTMRGKTEVEVINEALAKFEKAIKPFMSPDGTLILTGRPSELVRLLGPVIQKLGQIIGG